MTMKGVDLSTWNGNVDFNALKAAGIKFVILRIGYGSYDSQKDDQFENNYKKAVAANMPWGVYTYSYAKNEAGGKSEAEAVIRWLKGRKPTFGIWYDMEDKSTVGGDLAGAAKGFFNKLKDSEFAGCTLGTYASASWFSGYLNNPVFQKYEKWVAMWSSVDDFSQKHGIWQNTDSLVIGGKIFDSNIAYVDYSKKTEEVTMEEFKNLFNQMRKEWQDNDSSGWSKEAREWAIKNNIISGIGKMKDGSVDYAWEDLITREQFVTMLKRYYDTLQ